MKEKNAALCRDAATLVTAGTEAKAAAQHRRKGAVARRDEWKLSTARIVLANEARVGRDGGDGFFSYGLNTDETRIYSVNLFNHSRNLIPFINSRRYGISGERNGSVGMLGAKSDVVVIIPFDAFGSP